MKDIVGRAKAGKLLSSCFIGVLVILSTSYVLSSKSVQSTEIIKIRISDIQNLDALKIRGAEIIADYDNSYVLVRVKEGESSYYERFYDVERMDDFRMIDLTPSGIIMNTTGPLPSIPQDLMYNENTDEYLIQFAGPIKKEWVTEIENMGGTFHNFYRFSKYHHRMFKK
jgi:hypothetical protein